MSRDSTPFVFVIFVCSIPSVRLGLGMRMRTKRHTLAWQWESEATPMKPKVRFLSNLQSLSLPRLGEQLWSPPSFSLPYIFEGKWTKKLQMKHLEQLRRIQSPFKRAGGASAASLDPEAVLELVQDATNSDPAWKLKAQRKECHVRVWRRKVPGSSWEEVRGSGVLKVPPEVVVALLTRSGEALCSY